MGAPAKAEASFGNPETRMLVGALGFLAGYLDAFAFVLLGGVFVSFMSGNSITLGVRIGQGEALSASRSILAIVGYVTGVAFGAIIAGTDVKASLPWFRGARNAFMVELSMLVIFVGVAAFAFGSLGVAGAFVLIVLASVPMGVQSAGVHALGVSGVSTTYVTGTWTSFIIGLVRTHRSKNPELKATQEQNTRTQVAVLVLYISGAAVSAIVCSELSMKAAIPPIILLGVLLLIYWRNFE